MFRSFGSFGKTKAANPCESDVAMRPAFSVAKRSVISAANAASADSRGREPTVFDTKKTLQPRSGDRDRCSISDCSDFIFPARQDRTSIADPQSMLLSPPTRLCVPFVHEPWADAHGYLLPPHSRLIQVQWRLQFSASTLRGANIGGFHKRVNGVECHPGRKIAWRLVYIASGVH